MNSVETPVETRALFSEDGKTWHDGTDVDWQPKKNVSPIVPVSKIVIGKPPQEDQSNSESTSLLKSFPANFADLYPELTHLYLWQIEDLKSMPNLPASLKCLDVRGCKELKTIANLPESLDTLVLDYCDKLELSEVNSNVRFPVLRDFSLKGALSVQHEWIDHVVRSSDSLRWIDFTNCSQLVSISGWPPLIERIDLNNCSNLEKLPTEWPPNLYRLGLRDSTKLKVLADFHKHINEDSKEPLSLDYLDLTGMQSLEHLPWYPETLRTLFIHDSGLHLPPELFGDSADENVAIKVLAHLQERLYDKEHGNGLDKEDHEVKVILLGNGRCGKSSLARRLRDDEFDPKEESTHGIRLWTMELEFTPINEPNINEKPTADVNIWDFAGQDLYHNTHRLFLQSKAVYVICITDHGDGFNPESDATPNDNLQLGDDIRRDVKYWKDQISSLGTAPGMDEGPPVLLVRTKSDRDNELSAPSQMEFDLDFSAKDSIGVEKLNNWLSSAVAKVLGSKDRRIIGSRPLAVKREIQELKNKNEQAHQEYEKTGKRIASPHPFLSRAQFNALVKKHCENGIYYEKPEVLLDFLHQSGFLFWSREYLIDRVILDQRWVIDGIYTVFHRKQCWHQLELQRGRFTLKNLRDWAWESAEYSADEQNLFLSFMESCGICFVLLNAGDTSSSETVYLAPMALPGSAKTSKEAENHRFGLEDSIKPIVLEHDLLSRDAVLQLLVELGREWRRAPVLWKWGGQFQSYRTQIWQGELTFVHLDWNAFSDDSFGGQLTIRLYGTDHTFLIAILSECEKLSGFEPVKQQLESYLGRLQSGNLPEVEAIRLEEESTPQIQDPRSVEAHRPTEAEATAVEIGISFAGDGQDLETHWSELPSDSIEIWPRAITERLQRMQIKVEQFRVEQNRDHQEQSPDRKDYMDRLMTRDFMIAFLSWKYLTSEWCMYELLQVYDRTEKRFLGSDHLRIGVFPDARMSQSEMEGEVADRPNLFLGTWMGKLKQFQNRVATDAGVIKKPKDLRKPKGLEQVNYHAIVREADQFAYVKWMDFVANATDFDSLKRALRNDNFVQLNYIPEDNELDKWAEQIARNLKSTKVLLELAKRSDKNGDREHAKVLLREAFERNIPDKKPGGIIKLLKKKFDDNVLNDIRRDLLEDLEPDE